MKNNKESSVKRIRQSKGLSRKELAERSGINFRSLQDYEQGHKDIASAKAETLYRLSLALGCGMEELLLDSFGGIGKQTVPAQNRVRRLSAYYVKLTDFVERIERQEIYSSEYKIHGRWKYENEEWYLNFCWKGENVILPFEAVFTEQTLPWLEDVAVMKINRYIQMHLFGETYTMERGEDLDEK